eukprot:scaffold47513_cov21-Tisochrysis_lutea.AAC.1
MGCGRAHACLHPCHPPRALTFGRARHELAPLTCFLRWEIGWCKSVCKRAHARTDTHTHTRIPGEAPDLGRVHQQQSQPQPSARSCRRAHPQLGAGLGRGGCPACPSLQWQQPAAPSPEPCAPVCGLGPGRILGAV